MTPLYLKFAALTTLLFASALVSCNQEKAPSERAETPQAEREPPPPSTSAAMPTIGDGTMDQLRAGCPLVVEGTEVAVADTDAGVALTFTTTEGDESDLRARVQHMAQMYEMHRGQGGMMWHPMKGTAMGHGGPGMGMGHEGRGMGHMAARGPMPAASATVTEVDKGARLELRPTDPAQLDALREQVRWHAERMRSGECWMLQE